MNTFKNCVIFSPEKNDVSQKMNLARVEVAEHCLMDIRASYKPVNGVYTHKNGVKVHETSFLVEYDHLRNGAMLDTIKDFAFKNFDQESVLHLDSNRNGTLIFSDGTTKNLGKLTSCEESKAKKLGNYTETNGCYYIFEE